MCTRKRFTGPNIDVDQSDIEFVFVLYDDNGLFILYDKRRAYIV